MELVVITGQSGAGRRTAAHAMEDVGWYVVDNLPPGMIPALTTYLHDHGIEKVAVVLDVRSRGDLESIPAQFLAIAPLVDTPHIMYIEADEAVIVRRQESSRRPVPLQGTGSMLDGIRAERRLLSSLRAFSDMVIDTSNLTIHQLRNRVEAGFMRSDQPLTMTVMSFGFKNGLPLDADFVVDVRFLPNPHWVPELRPQTGLSHAVAQYVLQAPAAQTFLDQVEAMIATASEWYVQEGKRQVLLAVGCTGGKHRSVAMAEEICTRLKTHIGSVSVIHRDLGRE